MCLYSASQFNAINISTTYHDLYMSLLHIKSTLIFQCESHRANFYLQHVTEQQHKPNKDESSISGPQSGDQTQQSLCCQRALQFVKTQNPNANPNKIDKEVIEDKYPNMTTMVENVNWNETNTSLVNFSSNPQHPLPTYLYYEILNNLFKCTHWKYNNTSPLHILCTLMPQIILLLTLVLVCTWYEESTLGQEP